MSTPTTQLGVWCHTGSRPERVGTAWISERRDQVSTTFTYDPAWLGSPHAHAVSPELGVSDARHHVARLPGALADCSPDRWGRLLIAKRDRGLAQREAGAPPQLRAVDYLLRVSDVTRQGALRFTATEDGPFLADHADVPKLIDLPRLLHAADAVDSDDESMAAGKALLDAGSGSLGGARPKASVRDGDTLAIAKFPHRSDDWDVMAWEKTTLDLAHAAGIRVPARRLVPIDGRHALVLDRFDRTATGQRVEYVSAMSLVGGTDGSTFDYLEVAEALAATGSAVSVDLAELWRRVAFGLLVNNSDDHLRNHGFLRVGSGWRLAPAFDLNPNPVATAQHATTIGFATGGREASLAALLDSCSSFGLSARNASTVLAEVADVVDTWRQVAASNGVRAAEIDRFASAFELVTAAR